MKSFNALGLALAAAIAATGFAAPASAQYWQGNAAHAGHDRQDRVNGNKVWQEITELDRKIDRADKRNTISQREANGLHRQVGELKRDFRRMSANGLDRSDPHALREDLGRPRRRNPRRWHLPDLYRPPPRPRSDQPAGVRGAARGGPQGAPPDLTLAVPDHNLPTTARRDAAGKPIPIADPESAQQLAALTRNAPEFGIR
jgi:hypothetical protein